MAMPRIKRGGTYYRVCDPIWKNPADTSWSRRNGGRWNPPGDFGALYLNASIAAAAANAQRSLRSQFGTGITFADLRENQRPQLQLFAVEEADFVDAVTPTGVTALGLPKAYPKGCGHNTCRKIGQKAYDADEAGIACRSAVAPTEEELALFDSHAGLATPVARSRKAFAQWYPGLTASAATPKAPRKRARKKVPSKKRPRAHR